LPGTGGAICYAVAPQVEKKLAGIMTFGGVFHFGKGSKLLKGAATAGYTLYNLLPKAKPGSIPIPLDMLAKAWRWLVLPLNTRLNVLPFYIWHPGSFETLHGMERVHKGFDRTSLEVMMMLMKWGAEGDFRSFDNKLDYSKAFEKVNVPLLVIAGNKDTLCFPEDARPAYDASGAKDKTFRMFSKDVDGVHFGHCDLLVGRHAPDHVWPFVLDWLDERTGR
jgi:polyhydroxyalkanoate synthase